MATTLAPPLKKFKSNDILAYRQQNWPFRNTFINYIAKNPLSSKSYQKLVQSCKYFFIENPYVVAEKLWFNDKENVWKASMKNTRQIINFKNLSHKLWTTECFENYTYFRDENNPNSISSIIPHFYRVDVTILKLCKQNLAFAEFLFLSANVVELHFYHVAVKDGNGVVLMLQDFIKNLPKVKNIEFTDNLTSSCITSSTVKELLGIPHFHTLNRMELHEISDNFDIESFFAYAKKNKNAEFLHVNFSHSISETYKNRLEIIVDEMIETLGRMKKEDREYRPPFTFYNGITDEKLLKIETIFYGYTPT